MAPKLKATLSLLPDSKHFWYYEGSRGFGALARTMLSPFLPLFFRGRFGFSVAAISFLFFVGGLIETVMSIPSGWLADKFGRKRTLALSSTSGFLQPVLLTQVVGYPQVFAVTTSMSAVSSTGGAASTAIVADLVEVEKRNVGYGVERVIGNAAWVVAPTLAGAYLAQTQNYDFLLYVSAALAFLSFLFFVALVPETRRSELPPPRVYSLRGFMSRNFAYICLASFFTILFYSQLYTLLPIFVKEVAGLSELEVGALFAISGVIVVAFQVPTSAIVNKVSKRPGLIAGILIMALGILAIGFVRTFVGFALAMILMTIGENIFFPLTTAIASELAPEAEKALFLGTFGLSMGLGFILSPLLGGLLWEFTGSGRMPWLATPIYAGIAVALALGYK